MLTHLRPAAVLLLLMTALTGLAYPLAMTGIAQTMNPARAAGSLITRDGRVIGSSLLAQDFTGAGYLHPRPSASGFVGSGSFGSNLAPTSAVLRDQVAQRRAAYQGLNASPAPLDAVTASASGLDPDISPENAHGQAARIADARGVSLAEVQRVISVRTTDRWLGLYGQPRVNVLLTNMALDAAFPQPGAGGNLTE